LEVCPQFLFAFAVDAAESVCDVPVERDTRLFAVVDDIESDLGLPLDDVTCRVRDGRFPLVEVDFCTVLAFLEEVKQFGWPRETSDMCRLNVTVVGCH
jgi:hypothetical protein